jgi:hypothetical protein
MQDIGGYRAILRTVQQIKKLVEIYKSAENSNPSGRSSLVKTEVV